MAQGNLTVDGLRVHAEGRTLLDIDTLTLSTGRLVGLRGPSGAGKTTLLNALSGLIAFEGNLRWGDADIAKMSARQRARFRGQALGMIFQDFLLFEELTAWENATIGRTWGRGFARAECLMDRFGIGHLAARSVARLSGGERQRVACVRALAHSPAIILADEPTASLDRATAEALIADLVQVAREAGASMVMVSHDETALAAMDHVWTMVAGRLEADHAG